MIFRDEMKIFYDKNGFLVVKQVLSDEELAGVRQRTDEIVADPDNAPSGISIGREQDTLPGNKQTNASNNMVRGAAFLVRYDKTFQAFANNPKILELVRGLIGPKIKVFRDQMLLKPPGGQAKPSTLR